MASTGPTPEPRLHCLNGAACPPEVRDGWNHFVALSDDVRARLWGLLKHVVLQPEAVDAAAVRALAREAGVAEDALGAAIGSAQFLIRQACTLDLAPELFGNDLAQLSGDGTRPARVILANFAETKTRLRQKLLHDALADHGKLLVGMNWRIDQMSASDRAVNLQADVVYLTLIYREGDDVGRVNLQVTPEAMKDLKAFCNRFDG